MRPFVHKILVVIEPLLIDEDYYARVEGEPQTAPPILNTHAAAASAALKNAQLRLAG